jgi:hypothetical protein
MVANTKAATPSTVVKVVYCDPADRRAPMMVIPEIALDPDIRGVCKMGGTLVMTSNPTKAARIKIVNIATNSLIVLPS